MTRFVLLLVAFLLRLALTVAAFKVYLYLIRLNPLAIFDFTPLNPYWSISNARVEFGCPYVLSRELVAPLPFSTKHRPTALSFCDAPPPRTSGS